MRFSVRWAFWGHVNISEAERGLIPPHPPTTEPPDHVKDIDLCRSSFLPDKIPFAFSEESGPGSRDPSSTGMLDFMSL